MDTGPALCSFDPSSLTPAHPVHGSAPWEALLPETNHRGTLDVSVTET